MTTTHSVQIPVVVVTGPTASGKTEVAIELAEEFCGEIVNADSMQVYRYLDIGTAKPSVAQRARVSHHLLDFVAPDDAFNAGRYAREAARVVDELHARGAAVFLTGGTGLYIRAFLEGLLESPGRDEAFRSRLEREHRSAVEAGDPELLHRRLRAVDEETALRIHPHDVYRTMRALELHHTTGEPASVLRERRSSRVARYRVLYLVIDHEREVLAERIERRCDAMIEGGLLSEVRELRARGYGPELPCMRAIGYRHMQPVLDGQESLAGVRASMVRDTKQYARRQRTWFRHVDGACWIVSGQRSALRDRVAAFLAA
ncbi:MAG: tRNA (adenosine(37)-N6)-dimethylallyltransferase MiaA [Myxococcales bacterium]|nr:tRNA (adenosine(37)-N6)-dimethylallyltransferase MiaA [Myxococcales bacterium]